MDVIINVVDASSLERNLYLTLQLSGTEKPVILALNMMDIVEERGMEIDLHRLPEIWAESRWYRFREKAHRSGCADARGGPSL